MSEVIKIVKRSDDEYERVAFAEVIIPNTPNSYNDVSTPEEVKAIAYEFARQGYGLDIEHDEVDVSGVKYYVVESFIARPGDPDFIEGSWVIGIKVIDDDLWQAILDGDINGFSYDAEMYIIEREVELEGSRTITGVTEPDPTDGHTHTFMVVLDDYGTVVAGGTGVTDGHSHEITSHTSTGKTNGHAHRYSQQEETQSED